MRHRIGIVHARSYVPSVIALALKKLYRNDFATESVHKLACCPDLELNWGDIWALVVGDEGREHELAESLVTN